MTDKVFCGKCKHHTTGPRGTHFCRNNMDVRVTAIRTEFYRDYCSDKNRDNNCIEYKPSLWTRIFG